MHFPATDTNWYHVLVQLIKFDHVHKSHMDQTYHGW